ncbi:MAG: histidine phosphatase family protein [Deltaproteobacteria bacterium]|nr:histidine phosphatase family protein [Candidatus Tharpella sp.]
MVKLWFIRHGQASFGKNDYDQLSPLGIRQSETLGDYLSKTGVCFDAIYSGELKRQKDTAKIIADKLGLADKLTPCNRLSEFNEYDSNAIIQAQLPEIIKEMNLSEKNMDDILADKQQFQKLFALIVERWMAGTYSEEGVETFKEFLTRVKDGLHTLLEKSDPGQQIAIFTSGGVISAGMQMGLGLSNDRAIRLGWRIRNSSVTLLGCQRGATEYKGRDCAPEMDLLLFNSTAHLDLDPEAKLITYR